MGCCGNKPRDTWSPRSWKRQEGPSWHLQREHGTGHTLMWALDCESCPVCGLLLKQP
jgi:hypothetical protein